MNETLSYCSSSFADFLSRHLAVAPYELKCSGDTVAYGFISDRRDEGFGQSNREVLNLSSANLEFVELNVGSKNFDDPGQVKIFDRIYLNGSLDFLNLSGRGDFLTD